MVKWPGGLCSRWLQWDSGYSSQRSKGSQLREFIRSTWEIYAASLKGKNNRFIVGMLLGQLLISPFISKAHLYMNTRLNLLMELVIGGDFSGIYSAFSTVAFSIAVYNMLSILSYLISLHMGVHVRRRVIAALTGPYLSRIHLQAAGGYEIICNDTRLLVSALFGSMAPVDRGVLFGANSLATFAPQLVLSLQQIVSLTQSTTYNLLIVFASVVYLSMSAGLTTLANTRLQQPLTQGEERLATLRQQQFDVQENIKYIQNYGLLNYEACRTRGLCKGVSYAQKRVYAAELLARFNIFAQKVFFQHLASAIFMVLFVRVFNGGQCMTFLQIAQFEAAISVINSSISMIIHANDYVVIMALVNRIGGMIREERYKGAHERSSDCIVEYHSEMSCQWDNVSVGSILSGFFATVPEGEHTCLVGASGCGKTSLLRALAGYSTITRGKIRMPDRRHCHFIPQNTYLGIDKTIRQEVLFDQTPTLSSDETDRVILALKKANLSHYVSILDTHGLNHQQNMSKHEQQQLQFARLFAKHTAPKFLILDEATSFIPDDISTEILKHVRAMDTTLISVAHKQAVIGQHKRIIEIFDDGSYEVRNNEAYNDVLSDSKIYITSKEIRTKKGGTQNDREESVKKYHSMGARYVLFHALTKFPVAFLTAVSFASSLAIPYINNITMSMFGSIQQEISCTDGSSMHIDFSNVRKQLNTIVWLDIMWLLVYFCNRMSNLKAGTRLAEILHDSLNGIFYKDQNTYQLMYTNAQHLQVRDTSQIINQDVDLLTGLIFGSSIPNRQSTFFCNQGAVTVVFTCIYLSFTVRITYSLYISMLLILLGLTMVQFTIQNCVLKISKRMSRLQGYECQLRAYFSQVQNNQDAVMFYQINDTMCVAEVREQMEQIQKYLNRSLVVYTIGEFTKGFICDVSVLLVPQALISMYLSRQNTKFSVERFKVTMYQLKTVVSSLNTLVMLSSEIFGIRSHIYRIGRYITLARMVQPVNNVQYADPAVNHGAEEIVITMGEEREFRADCLNNCTGSAQMEGSTQKRYTLNKSFLMQHNEDDMFKYITNTVRMPQGDRIQIFCRSDVTVFYNICQENYFFRDKTLYENITEGKYRVDQAALVQLMQELKFRQSTCDMIDSVFEFNVVLSGGEKQRIKVLKLLLFLQALRFQMATHSTPQNMHVIITLQDITNQLNQELGNEILRRIFSEVESMRNSGMQLTCLCQCDNTGHRRPLKGPVQGSDFTTSKE